MPAAHPDAPTLARRTATISFVVAGVVVGVLAAWKAIGALLLLFGAYLVALLLTGIGGLIAHRTRLSVRHAVIVAVVLLALVLLGVLALLGTTVASELARLGEALPEALAKARALVEGAASRFGIDPQSLLSESSGGGWGRRIAAGAAGAVGGLGSFALMVAIGVFFAIRPRVYRGGLLHLAPHAYRDRIGAAFADVSKAVRKWLVARLIIMAANGVLVGVGLTIVGIPFALGLALIAFATAFVPYVGAYVGAGVGILAALAAGPEQALYAVLVYVVIENGPMPLVEVLAESRLTDAPPALLIGAIVVFGTLLGLPGLVLASPLVVAFTVLVQKLYVQDALGDRVEVLGQKDPED